jgi:hypothetical protein
LILFEAGEFAECALPRQEWCAVIKAAINDAVEISIRDRPHR